MKVAIAGPIETRALSATMGLDLGHLPQGQGPSPVVPLVAQLVSSGFETHLVTLDGTIETPVMFHHGRLKITFVPLRVPPRYAHRVRMLDLFKQEIRQLTEAILATNCQIVNAHWTYEYAEAAVRSRIPHVVTMHDLGLDYLRIYRDAYRFMRVIMKYRVMPRVRNLIAVSPFVAAKAWQYGYFRKIDLIPNPISEPGPNYRNQHAVNFVTIGNAGRIKNVTASISAFDIIRAEMPSSKLHLFGPQLEPCGPLPESEGVLFHGNVPHAHLMRFLEQEATLLLHPSRMETFGVILAEAKIRGVPVVAGADSGGVGYVVNGAGGVLVDIERPQAIAEAALKILRDPLLYARMQQLGKDDVNARFNVKSVTAAYVETFERILSENLLNRVIL